MLKILTAFLLRKSLADMVMPVFLVGFKLSVLLWGFSVEGHNPPRSALVQSANGFLSARAINDAIWVSRVGETAFMASSKDIRGDLWEYSFDACRDRQHAFSSEVKTRGFSSSSTWTIPTPSFVNRYWHRALIRTNYSDLNIEGRHADYSGDPAVVSCTVTLTSDVLNSPFFCSGDTVVFTATSTSVASTYTFSVNGIQRQSSLASVFRHTLSGNSTVTVLINAPQGCTASSTLFMRATKVNDPGAIKFGGNNNPTMLICSGMQPPVLTSSMDATVVGGIVYEWQSSIDGGTAGSWSPIEGANEKDYQPPALADGLYHFRRVVKTEGGCIEGSNVLEIRALPEIVGGMPGVVSQTICQGDRPAVINITGGSAAPTDKHQWQKSTTGSDYNDIVGATAESYRPEELDETTHFRRVTSNLSGVCSATSEVHKVTVIELDAGLFGRTTQNICFGEAPRLFSTNGGRVAESPNSILSYQWEKASIIDGNLGEWQEIPGATGSTYQSNLLTESSKFRRKVIGTLDGKVCEKFTEEVIEITVLPEIITGYIDRAQTICMGSAVTLTLVDFSDQVSRGGVDTRVNYKWQSSTDGRRYEDVPGVGQNVAVLHQQPSVNTYYRVYFYVGALGSTALCSSATTEPVLITVGSAHTITTLSGPESQVVCPLNSMTPIEIQYGGGARNINLPELRGTGLVVNPGGRPQTYVISGQPFVSVTITVKTVGVVGNACSPISKDYTITVPNPPSIPDVVRIDGTTLWKEGEQTGPYAICQGDNSSQFSAEFTEGAHQIEEWELVSPAIAGSIDKNTGSVTWNNAFFGDAVFRVRGRSLCDPSRDSGWSSLFTITVIESGVGDIEGNFVIEGDGPVCQITGRTPDTQYTARDIPINLVFWKMSATEIGNPDVPSPGNIDFRSGLVNWNPGFWGTVNIYAYPTNCDSDNDPRTDLINPVRSIRTVVIPEAPQDFGDIINLAVGERLPICPGETGGMQTKFESGFGGLLRWTIDNTNAGFIGGRSGVLRWANGFSGSVRVIASTGIGVDNICDVLEERIRVDIPKAPSITLSSGFNSNRIATCRNTAISTITYSIEGAATGAVFLPESDLGGVLGNYSTTRQRSSFTVSGISTSAGEIYSVILPLHNYRYKTSGAGETAAHVASQLVLGMAGNPNVNAAVSGSTITLTGKISGEDFKVETEVMGISPALRFSEIITVPAERKFTISGTPTAPPGTYSYSVSTIAATSSCSIEEAIGTITIHPAASISLDTSGGSERQSVCNQTSIEDIIYEAADVEDIVLEEAPNGIIAEYDRGAETVTISGTPNVNASEFVSTGSGVSQAIYSYTLRTIGNSYSCNEASVTGKITVTPNGSISLISVPTTKNQEICSRGESPIEDIVYRLEGGATGYRISDLPPGIGAEYDSATKTIKISGIVVDDIDSEKEYIYRIETTGSCSQTTVTGTIMVNPAPTLELVSASGTDNQTGSNAVCGDASIASITYVFEGALSAEVEGLPPGVIYSITGNRVEITNRPNDHLTPRTYEYLITTTGSNCPEATTSGKIEVNPLPRVNVRYITENDLSNVSSFGGSDGSIRIPEEPTSEFDRRISGRQNNIRQVDHVEIGGELRESSVFSIKIEETFYQYPVVLPGISATEIANELIAQINRDREGVVLASLASSTTNTATIKLSARVAGVSFRGSANEPLGAVVRYLNVVENKTSNYSYRWTGPNGFTGSDLSIENLEAGTYNLTVRINDCEGEAYSFEITEPDPLRVTTDLCNGAISATASGGIAPYTFNLYDRVGGRLIKTSRSNDGLAVFTELAPGVNYFLEVDASGSKEFIPFTLPLELRYEPNNATIESDYCSEEEGYGAIYLFKPGLGFGSAFRGGSNQFEYSWTGPDDFRAYTRDITGLKAGEYTVEVRDEVLGCTGSKTFTVGAESPLTIVPIGRRNINLNCKNDVTDIEIEVSGGFGNYEYTWTRNGHVLVGRNGPGLENVGVGEYIVTVSDRSPSRNSSRPCERTETFTVNEPEDIDVLVNSATGAVLGTGFTTTAPVVYCPGDDSASFNIQILGGTPPFTTLLNDGDAGTHVFPDNGIFSINGLNPSETGPTYTIKITDANGCSPPTAIKSVSFRSVSAVDISAAATQIDCQVGVLGSIALNVNNGVIFEPREVKIQWITPYGHLHHTWGTNGGRLENIKVGGEYTVIVSQADCELFRETITMQDADDALRIDDLKVDKGGCNGELGRVELIVGGGFPPYSIRWEQFKFVDATSTAAQWVTLPEYNDNLIASDLGVGTYRATVSDSPSSQNSDVCGGSRTTGNIAIGSSVFEIVDFRTNLNGCGDGDTFGEILFGFRNTFPTNTIKITLDGSDPGENLTRLGNGEYRIGGILPGEHTLNIDREVGTSTNTSITSDCESIAQPFTIEEVPPIEIGIPDFEYSTSSLKVGGGVLAKEDITFKNTSPLPYSYSLWIFGDGTEYREERYTETVSPVRHRYDISGTYFVTLQNYGNSGCYEETTKAIEVGEGYSFLAPGVFSPNDDSINDKYRVLFSGFQKVTFRIYDSRGNKLYEENVEEADIENPQGLSISGWDGVNATDAPHFIYLFSGELNSNRKEITRSGTFILLR